VHADGKREDGTDDRNGRGDILYTTGSNSRKMNDGSNRTDAPGAFAERAQAEHGDSIRHLVAFGSAARGDDPLRAEAELLVVLEACSVERERELDALAREVSREQETVLTLHVLPGERFDSGSDHPLVREAFEEGHVYV
jgi:hypothetical protein